MTEPATRHPWILVTISLAIRKIDLDPATVTERLGITPTRAGGPRNDGETPGKARYGFWYLEYYDDTSDDFSRLLDTILSAIEDKRDGIAELVAEGCTARLHVDGYTLCGTLTFSARDIERISEINIPLILSPNTNAR